MDHSVSHGKLDSKINETLKRLDQLLALLDGYKPVLEHNANSAAVEIKANFNGILDTLYQRQLILLGQLDKVFKEKLALIDSSKQTIDALRTGIMSCVATRHTSDSRIHEYISRSEAVLLNSSSAPFLSFRAERCALAQAIANYGRVVTRYSGHFADPSQPSSCLPLSVEGEDDHEESHDPATMIRNVSGSCPFMKTEWRHWLLSSSDHYFVEPDNSDANWLMSSDSSASRQALHFDSSANGKKGNKSLSRFSELTSLSRFIESKQHPMLQEFLRSSGIPVRKRTKTLTSLDSDHTATSDSFTILTGSANSRLTELKDWLFCDPAELDGMPGLSVALPAAQQKRDVSATQVPKELTSNWSLPCSTSPNVCSTTTQSVATSMTTGSTLSSLLPLDLSRWLHPQSEFTYMEHRVDITEPSLQPLDRCDETVELRMTKRCPYSQCIGGPGGPTCCGARMQLSFAEADAESTYSDIRDPMKEPTVSSSHPAVTSGSSVHPVVSQLNQIAATHWTKWVIEPPVSEELVTPCSVPAFQTGRCSPIRNKTTLCQQDIEEFIAFEDPVVPPKRRTIEKSDPSIGKDATWVVQSPFVNLADVVDSRTTPGSPRSCSRSFCKLADRTPVDLKRNEKPDDCEEWLSQKLSNLSTATTDGVEKWLTDRSANAPAIAETRLKLE